MGERSLTAVRARSDTTRHRSRISLGLSAPMVILLLGVPLGQAAGQAPAGGTLRAELSGRSVDLRLARHRAYLAFNGIELVRSLLSEGTVAAQSLRARLAGRDLVLEAGSPFFRLGDETYQLANAPYEWGGAFWIPSDFLTVWWPRAVGSGGRLAGTGEGDLVAPITPRPRRDPSRPMRVIIDPGHGGRDPGTLAQGVREKDIVLGIAGALARALEARGGFEPSLTRDRDVFIPIQERSRIAVRRAGELFVSIHVNSVPGRGGSSANGFETYFLGPERSEEAREVALRENSVIQYENGAGAGIEDDLQFILTGLDRNENTVESRRFAGCVQNAMRRNYSSRRDRGVKQGKFWVLLGALTEMPSVIVEVGFITNVAERRMMTSSAGQEQIAATIAEAIADYKVFLDEEAGATGGAGGGGSC